MKSLKAGKKKNGGFTLIEMLVVTVMLTTLLAVGVIHVVRNARLLKVTELDNMAREIYLAAENRAVLLARNGRLEAVVKEEGTLLPGTPEKQLYIVEYKPDKGMSKELLPEGLIEPSLLNGSFYIVYETKTGNVADVFYAEKTEDMEYAVANSFGGSSGGVESFYVNWKGASANDTDRAGRVEKKTKVGYYGSEVTSIPESVPEATSLPAPEITIVNGEELILKVKYKSTGTDGRVLKTTLTYGSNTVTLPEGTPSLSGGDIIRTWTLDTVSPNGYDKQQFKDWLKDVSVDKAFGGDFTVNAVLEQEGALSALAEPKKENSLFGTASGDGANAYIDNVRHLQNLDQKFSGVSGKTEAHQIGMVDASGNEFHPIDNGELMLYKSYMNGDDYFTIKNLEVTADSMKYNEGGTEQVKEGAGLFSKAGNISLENVCMVNARIDGDSSNKPAGALIGLAGNVSLSNCRVYWEEADAANMLKQGDAISYQICGTDSGGVIGKVSGGTATITGSFAATTVSGKNAIGGLIGSSEEANITIEKSYADCYLSGIGISLFAGGLIGNSSTETSVKNAYAAGYIENVGIGGGLCGNGAGSFSAENVYAAVFHQQTVTNAMPFWNGVTAIGNGCYFFQYTECNWNPDALIEAQGRAYDDYDKMAGTDFMTLINTGNAFDKKTVGETNRGKQSNPYNVLASEDAGRLGDYDFPGIVGLPHYGDWKSDKTPVKLHIINGDELILEVKPSSANPVPVDATVEVELRYDGMKAVSIIPAVVSAGSPTVPAGDAVTPIASDDESVTPATSDSESVDTTVSDGEAVTYDVDPAAGYTWICTLDTLKAGGSRFKDCFTWKDASGSSAWKDATGKTLNNTAISNLSAGKDFSVRARFVSGGIKGGWSNLATSNSLFDYYTKGSVSENSNGETARIGNLRHLQNLDKGLSGVKGKTAALQIADIEAGGYEFVPIENRDLKSYTADAPTGGSDNFKIRGLTVTPESCKRAVNGTGTSTNYSYAGLFSIAGGTGTEPFLLKNVRMVNASIEGAAASYGGYAGGLVGMAGYVTIDGCRVYWDDPALLKDGANVAYKIKARTYAGGLVGYLSTNSSTNTIITDSFAATTIQTSGQGTNAAGGLVGYVQGNVSVTKSYADCYLKGYDATHYLSYVGGLIGWFYYYTYSTNKLMFENVYAAGFIENSDNAGGLIGTDSGAGTGWSIKNAYAAIYYGNRVTTVHSLASGVAPSDTDNRYYLQYNNRYWSNYGTDYYDGTYLYKLFAKINEGSGGAFEIGKTVSAGDANPYNLSHPEMTDSLGDYTLPGLKGLPHYGDWKAPLLYGSTLCNMIDNYYQRPELSNYYETMTSFEVDVSVNNIAPTTDVETTSDGITKIGIRNSYCWLEWKASTGEMKLCSKEKIRVYGSLEKMFNAGRFNNGYSKFPFTNLKSVKFNSALDTDEVMIDTSRVTNMNSMFYNCPKLTDVQFGSNFNTGNVTTMESMFYDCPNLASVQFGSNFDTVNVTNMQSMFYNCNQLGTLDVSNWNVSKVTNMSSMFNSCKSLTSLDLTLWNTSNVTNMANMFSTCTNMTSLNLSGWDVRKAASMGGMFSNYPQAAALDITRWTIGNSTDVKGMIGSFGTNRTIFKLSSWNTSEVTTMSQMFYNCNSLTSLDLSDWDTDQVADMSFMFQSCSNLANINFSGWDTNSVTNMYGMFYYCSKLTSPNLSDLDTGNVTDMGSMFASCSGLTSLNFPAWNTFDTRSVTNMTNMFSGCSSLQSLDLSSFNTASVTNMQSMFSSCSGLTSLNLSSFTTGKVTTMSHMFYNCYRLTSLDLSSFTTGNVTTMYWMFYNCNRLQSLTLPAWATGNVTTMYQMFYQCSALQNLICPNLSEWDVSNVTTMYQMFYKCEKLPSLNLANWKIANLKNMGSMFYECKELEVLDMSNWNTGSVTDMSSAFYYCYKLKNLDVSKWDTGNVTNMYQIFYNCNQLGALDVSKWNTVNVTNMQSMFYNCNQFGTLDVSNWNTGNVTNMNSIFSGCTSLTNLDVSNWNTGKVTDMTGVFQYCWNLTSLDVSNWNTGKVNNMSYMFNGCRGLTEFDLSTWDTSTVSNMYGMFMSCIGLTKLDLSTFKTGNVINMRSMFSGCTGLEELDLSTWNLSRISYDNGMEGMLYYCNNLKKLNLSEWTITDSKKVGKIFYDSYYRTKIDADISLNDWNISGTTSLEGVFQGWPVTKTLDLSTWDTSHVTSMKSMFSGCTQLPGIVFGDNFNTANVTNMYGMFGSCSALTNLDLSKFNTEKVTDMSAMFNNCNKLTNIDLSKFNTTNVTNMGSMFSGCSGLTSIDLSKFNTEKVTNMSSMFYNCPKLTSLDLSPLNTANVTDMGSMFSNCSGLTTLNLSTFNTGNVMYMYSMFNGCSSLTSLNLSSFNTGNVTSMFYMFRDCTNLTDLNLYSFNTAKVTNMTYMFYGCTKLERITIGDNFRTTEVAKSTSYYSYMFRNGTYLVKIYLNDATEPTYDRTVYSTYSKNDSGGDKFATDFITARK